MATANAMFDRLEQVVPSLFAEGETASLTLAHGAAAIHPAYRPAMRIELKGESLRRKATARSPG